MENIDYLLSFYIKLFILSSPPLTALGFLGLTRGCGVKERLNIAFKCVCVASVILLLAIVFGVKIFAIMGVGMPALRVGAGFLLFVLGFNLVRDRGEDVNSKKSDGKIDNSSIVVPLAFPLISGPGALSTSIIFTSEAQNNIQHMYAYVGWALIMFTFIILLYFVIFLSKYIKSWLLQIITNMSGLLILISSIQLMFDGISGLINGK